MMASVTPHLNLVKLEMTDKIDGSIPNLAQNATKIDDAVKKLEEQAFALREDMDQNKDAIALNQDDISNNVENINQINEDLDEVRANIDAVKERVNELNEVADNNKSMIEWIQTKMIDFEERLSALEKEESEESEIEEE